jgi:PadR family transcriptional regulator, regulatory protein PadR
LHGGIPVDGNLLVMTGPSPLREPTFLVLAALGPGPLHGYGIIKAVEQMSQGRVQMRAGTLYGALERLEAQGFVAFDREVTEGGPVRRYFKLTKDGKSLLAGEATRLQANAALAFARLGIEAP